MTDAGASDRPATPPGPPEPDERGLLRGLATSRWGGLVLVAGSIGAWFVAQVAVGVVLGVVIAVQAGGQLDAATMQAKLAAWMPVLVGGSTGAALLVLAALHLLDGLPDGPPRVASPARSVGIVVAMALACLLGEAGITWAQRRAGLDWAEQKVIVDALGGGSWWTVALTLVVLAPLGEELVFRRITYRALCAWGRPAAVLVSAFAFALAHGNLEATFLYVWIALTCTLAYEKTGRIGAAIAVHALNNLVAVVGK